MIEDAEEFIKDYIDEVIQDLGKSLLEDNKKDTQKYEEELNTALCIAEGLGAAIKKDTIAIPKVTISWSDDE